MQTPVPTLPFSLSLFLPSDARDDSELFANVSAHLARKCCPITTPVPSSMLGSQASHRVFVIIIVVVVVVVVVVVRKKRERKREKEREKHANRFDSNRIVSLSLSNKSLSSKLCRSAQRGDAKINKRRRQTTKKALFFDATTRAKRKRTRKALLFRRKRRTT